MTAKKKAPAKKRAPRKRPAPKPEPVQEVLISEAPSTGQQWAPGDAQKLNHLDARLSRLEFDHERHRERVRQDTLILVGLLCLAWLAIMAVDHAKLDQSEWEALVSGE